jgi:hypothetical protein
MKNTRILVPAPAPSAAHGAACATLVAPSLAPQSNLPDGSRLGTLPTVLPCPCAADIAALPHFPMPREGRGHAPLGQLLLVAPTALVLSVASTLPYSWIQSISSRRPVCAAQDRRR